MTEDRYAIACNYTMATKTATKGTKAYVILSNPGNGGDRVQIRFRSRGGRWISKWEDTRRLGNFRRKTIPPESRDYEHAWPDPDSTDRTVGELPGFLASARDTP